MARVNEWSHNSFAFHPHVYPQVEWTIPAFTPQPQSITALWLVLISCPTEDRRLSWPGWLGEILRRFARLKTVTHPSTNRAWRRVTSMKRPTTLLLRHTAVLVCFKEMHRRRKRIKVQLANHRFSPVWKIAVKLAFMCVHLCVCECDMIRCDK